MKKIEFLFLLFFYITANGQIQEHKCPDNAIFKKQKIKKEIVCMCLHGDTLNGLTIIYSNKGNKVEENYWDMGVKSGTWKEWNDKGNLVHQVNYKQGQKDSVEIYYYNNGKPKVLTTYVNGQKNGRIVEWTETGRQISEGYFSNNLQDKIWIFRMSDNKTVSVAKYKDGNKLKYKFFKWEDDLFSVNELEKLLD